MPKGFVPTGGSGWEPVGPHFDGPWVRSAREIDEMWEIVNALVEAIAAAGDRSPAELSYAERYTLGMRAAARWTVGLTARIPPSGEELPPDRRRAVAERVLADLLSVEGRLPGDPAAGVHAWLAWLTGAVDELVFIPL